MDASANTLSTEVLEELKERLDQIEGDEPAALVIRSAKASGFIAGADITEFKDLAKNDQAREHLRRGHAILDRIAAFPFPTIAVVHAFALGGGFELALACDYRIAVEVASFGFPEVRLGLHPGLGGTFRLTDLIDPVEAMTMMLTGKTAHTDKARKLGIVDKVVPERHVNAVVKAVVDGEVERHQPGLKESALALAPTRRLAARRMHAESQAKAPVKHYPAPYSLIELWREHGGDQAAMQEAEIDSFAELMNTGTAKNLQRVYFLRETLKSLGENDHGITRVHVVGAGSMGGDIAGWCAIQGFRVTLSDLDNQAIAKAIGSAEKVCQARHLTSMAKRDALDRLIPDPEGHGAALADLIIEAVPEQLPLKQDILASLESTMKKGAILVSNTSSIELSDIVSALERPDGFAGLHFFNPVSKLELVEVVQHADTDEEVLRRLRAFVRSISRLPAPVKSYPGFLVNRALMPYLMEALLLVDEGIDKEVIDRAAVDFGMPMGPIEVADQVGLDVCLHVAESLRDNLDKPLASIPDWFRDKVEAGELGRKTGKGFYDWKQGKAEKSARDDDAQSSDDLQDRLILPMIDACVECLRLDVVSSEEIIDGAMIFATGFAPFRGGPMHYAHQTGIDTLIGKLERLAELYGPRFKPDDGWSTLRASSD